VINGIDHVLIAVENLERAINTWSRLGFQVLRGGEHPQFGTHNALVPLADGAYFELIAIKNPSLAQQFPVTRGIQDALGRENRFVGFALDSEDLTGDVQAIRDRGLTLHKAPPGERLRPDGQRVQWRTAHPEDSRLPFLIQDVTPREVRIPLPTEGIGRRLRLLRLTVTAKESDSLGSAFAQILGPAETDTLFGMKRGQIHVDAVSSEDGIHSVVIGTTDLDTISRGWESQQVLFRKEPIPAWGLALALMDTAGAHILVVKG
jgi:catechol 2,3-dioxygenase-like lactoylglutathione lyase family enzyme